jgi:hypothetical protein
MVSDAGTNVKVYSGAEGFGNDWALADLMVKKVRHDITIISVKNNAKVADLAIYIICHQNRLIVYSERIFDLLF